MTRSAFYRLHRTSQKRGKPRRRTAQLRLETLEDRWMPSIVVNTALDDWPMLNINPNETIGDVNSNPPQAGISLRDAIYAANNSGPGSVIQFDPILNAVSPIVLKAALPPLVANGVKIESGAKIDSGQQPLIEEAGGIADGLMVTGNYDQVIGLDIETFDEAGIRVEGKGDAISTCAIRSDGAGMANGSGVYVFHAVGLSVDSSSLESNVGDGVRVEQSAGITLNNNSIEGNSEDGIVVIGGLRVIRPNGFVTKTTANEIDDNLANGIHLIGSSNNIIGTGQAVDINYIGTDRKGDPTDGNTQDGVLIESSAASLSAYNSITRNYICDNHGIGVNLMGPGTSQNSLTKNVIGIGIDDKTPVGNATDGVALSGGANHNQVGGDGLFNSSGFFGDGNLISSNDTKAGNGLYAAVHLSDAGTTLNQVQGNMIGTDASGTEASPNKNGVIIENGASNNLIGGAGGTGFLHGGQGNLISGNTGAGVDIRGAGTNHNQVQGNWIGTDCSGAMKLGNETGVVIEQGASSNSVGGVPALLSGGSLGNVISGNNKSGVALAGGGTTGNFVQANEIGTTSTGESALGNTLYGVVITAGASSNLVGGSPLPFFGSTGNLISGNHDDGVELDTTGTTNNKVQGNMIGTNWSGSKVLSNRANGVVLTRGASANFIGGDSPAAGNLISVNWKSGVVIDLDTTANFVQHNMIGTGATGFGALGNLKDGVDLLGSGNTVADNLISTNASNGLVLQGSQNTIQGNQIGTNVSEDGPLGNQHDGVLINITSGPGGNTVGGTAAGAGNLICGNVWNGIEITGPASADNHIVGNLIGTNAAGSSFLFNSLDGILVKNTTGYTIGGEMAGAGNLVSGNHGNGVEISGFASKGIVLLGNRIGTNAGGTAAVPNWGNGVHIDKGAGGTLIGGTGTTDGNLISGNKQDGVLIDFYYGPGNKVFGNQIGTDVNGQFAIANQQNGVEILQAGNNLIGGDAVGAGNLISGNKQDGIRLANGAQHNLVAGNLIGTNLTKTKDLPNEGHGVDLLQGALHNSIGGMAAANGNVIAHNGKAGVAVGASSQDKNTVHNAILSNSIYGNLKLGIDLGDDGVTLNTPGGPHIGPNEFQNAPAIDGVATAGPVTTVIVDLNSMPLTLFTIQIFANAAPDATGYGQGKTLLTTVPLNTNTAGNGSAIAVVMQNVAGQFLSATATAPSDDTSEFGRDMQVPAGRVAPGGGMGSSNPSMMLSPAEREAVSGKVDVGLANGSRLVPAQRLADTVFGNLTAHWDGVPTHAAKQVATQAMSLLLQDGEDLVSRFDRLWADFAE